MRKDYDFLPRKRAFLKLVQWNMIMLNKKFFFFENLILEIMANAPRKKY